MRIKQKKKNSQRTNIPMMYTLKLYDGARYVHDQYDP